MSNLVRIVAKLLSHVVVGSGSYFKMTRSVIDGQPRLPTARRPMP